jgi:multiple sugar transport system permease protein
MAVVSSNRLNVDVQAVTGPSREKQPMNLARLSVYLLMAVMVFITIVPLLVVLKTAIAEPKGFFSNARSLTPADPTLLNFRRVLGMVSKEESIAVGGSGAEFNYLGALRDSLIFTVVAGVGQIFFSSMAAYAFARLRFPGRNFIFGLMLSALMIPGVVLFLPNFVLMKNLNWLNSYQGMIAPYFLMTPFAVFFMRQFFLGFPVEIEESARLDGASTFRIFSRIVLPLSKGPLATLSILTAINLWNEFFWPSIIGQSNDAPRPLTVALSAFKSQQPQGGIDWPGLMAGTCLAVLPVLVLLIVLGRKVVESIQFSGGK